MKGGGYIKRVVSMGWCEEIDYIMCDENLSDV